MAMMPGGPRGPATRPDGRRKEKPPEAHKEPGAADPFLSAALSLSSWGWFWSVLLFPAYWA